MAVIVFPKRMELSPEKDTRQPGSQEKKEITIRILTGELAGKEISFETGLPITIGRDPKICELVLQGYPRVSRNHCTVFYDSQIGKFYLTDTSLNGTHLLLKHKKTMKLYPLKKGKLTVLEPDSVLFLADENCIIRIL